MLQGASKDDHIELIMDLFFSGEVAYPLGGSEIRDPGHIYIFLASGQPSTIPHNTFFV